MSLGMTRPSYMESGCKNILNKQSQTADKGCNCYCRYGTSFGSKFFSSAMMPLVCNVGPTFRKGSLPSASCSNLKVETANALEFR